jgi:hypothetical protein
MAQAILLQPVDTLGERGEIVDVSPGYLRNYLVPPTAAGDPRRAQLALLTHRATQRGEVLVVDDFHLVAAELAGLAPATRTGALPAVTTPGCPGPCSTTLLCHAKLLCCRV